MEDIDVAVIGAGVTGLAAARAIARTGRSTCVLERHPRPGLDTSTHNSGVIHAGLYYPTGSLKARLCVEGARLLYHFCEAHEVPHARTGKLVVATPSTGATGAAEETQVPRLLALQALGTANGVEGLQMVDQAFIAAREPHVDATTALYSPNSGIVDAEELIKTLLRLAEADGVVFLPATRLVAATRSHQGMVLETERETILARQVVNAAGLYADDVSRLLGGETFTIYPVRGEYAELTPARRSLVGSLVYPLPHADGHGLGVHLVKTMSGEVWLGPTAKYQERKDDYEGHRLPLEAFVEPARRLLRDVTLADLRLSGSGIRPKLSAPGQVFADFMIRRDQLNSAVVQASGIESPGLTSCLAVGDAVARIVCD